MQKELSLVSNSPSRKEVKTTSEAHVDKLLKEKKPKTSLFTLSSIYFLLNIFYLL